MIVYCATNSLVSLFCCHCGGAENAGVEKAGVEKSGADRKAGQEAQLPQRDSASATHVFLGSLTDRALH